VYRIQDAGLDHAVLNHSPWHPRNDASSDDSSLCLSVIFIHIGLLARRKSDIRHRLRYPEICVTTAWVDR